LFREECESHGLLELELELEHEETMQKNVNIVNNSSLKERLPTHAS
jgi:hypothetical protein